MNLRVIQGRNLLNEFQQGFFDPLDTEINANGIPTVLAAPNGTGKTTLMQTIGQLCYLAQCGCPIAVEGAQLPIFTAFLSHMSLQEDKEMQRSFFYKSVESIMALLKQKARNE